MTSATSRTEESQIHDNGVRAVRAADAMIAYARRCGTGTEELPTVFADFLSDVHHLADALGVEHLATEAQRRSGDEQCAHLQTRTLQR